MVLLDLKDSNAVWIQKGNSRYAPVEAQQARSIVSALAKSHPNKKAVVLSFYNAQVDYFNHLSRSSQDLPMVPCYSVDSFQGKEANFIVLLTCAYGSGMPKFLRGINRVNVALSRAKEKLIVIGDSTTMCIAPLWKNILKYFTKVTSVDKAL